MREFGSVHDPRTNRWTLVDANVIVDLQLAAVTEIGVTSVQRYYPYSPVIEAEIHAQVRKLLVAGVVEPSTSPWSSPVVMVKKSGGGYRMYIDFRKANAQKKFTDGYPSRRIDAAFRKIRKARYVTTIDVNNT